MIVKSINSSITHRSVSDTDKAPACQPQSAYSRQKFTGLQILKAETPVTCKRCNKA